MRHELAITLDVTRKLEDHQIPYMLVGSVASAFHGLPRTTLGPNIVLLGLRLMHVPALVEALQDYFEVDGEAVRAAITGQSQFTLVHRGSRFVIDLFVAPDKPFTHAQFLRRQRVVLNEATGAEAWIASIEDMLLAKLVWYQDSNHTNSAEWDTIVRILREQGEKLDAPSMQHWAERLGVTRLLDDALREADAVLAEV